MRSSDLAAMSALVSVPIVIFAASESVHPTNAQGILEQIVVTVNGDLITKSEIDERMRVTRALAEDTEPTDPAMLTRVLRDAIDERLMMQRAAELGMDVRDDEVDRVLETVKEQSHVGSDDEFRELLEREGMSLSTLRANTRRRLIIDQVRERLFSRIAVSNDEALRYFNANRQQLVHRERVTFRELRIPVPRPGRVPDAERDRALVQVVRARDQLVQGVPFESVAAAFSGGSSRNDDRIGPVDVADVDAALRATLKSLEPGAVSSPIEIAEGYAFVKLEGHEVATTSVFRDNREQIVEMLLKQKQQAALEDLLDRLRGAALLQWKRRDFQAAYDRPTDYR